MDIVFFGSDNFAVPPLKALIASNHRIFCVVTQPDRKRDRGLHIIGTPVKSIALNSSLKIYQPAQVNSGDSLRFLKELSPDLFVVIAYGQILSREVLEIPKIFSINVHGSLLPKYRGAAPINWALINGDKLTGITIIKMTEMMDAGPIILKEGLEIEDSDDAITLEEKLSQKAPALLIDSLKLIENKKHSLKEQDKLEISFAPRLKKNDGLIDWGAGAEDIYNLIRGCLGWPGAFTHYKGRLLKVHKARVVGTSGDWDTKTPGEIMQVLRDGIVVATGNGSLIIEELQMEGKKKMKVEEFIAGHKISKGEILNKNVN